MPKKKLKVPTVKPPKKLMVMLSDRLYRKIAKMAKTERRTVSQQLLYLMDIGLDFIEQQMDTYAIADTSDKSSTENSEELSPAIGFKIE
jgi:hypothetical protein